MEAWNPSIWEARGLKDQSHPWLYSELEASLAYMRPHLIEGRKGEKGGQKEGGWKGRERGREGRDGGRKEGLPTWSAHPASF